MKLPKLTKKQQEILKLLYKFRFLNRIQIQALMGHKDPKTINLWLRDLRAKGYVEWIYSTHFAEKTKPAIYYLELNGIRQLRTLTISYLATDDSGIEIEETEPAYPLEELRKRYKEPTRSQTFIDHCLLIADCCIALEKENAANNVKSDDMNDGEQQRKVTVRYYYQTEASYLLERSYYHFILDSEIIRPSLMFCKDALEKDSKQGNTLESYLLEVFDVTLPRYRMKKRLSDYVQFLDEEGTDWQELTETEKPPVTLFVCPRTTDLIYAKRRMRGLLSETWEREDEERPCVRFTTIEKLKQNGLLDERIWEEA